MKEKNGRKKKFNSETKETVPDTKHSFRSTYNTLSQILAKKAKENKAAQIKQESGEKIDYKNKVLSFAEQRHCGKRDGESPEQRFSVDVRLKHMEGRLPG
jgi:hypothetical protein